MNPWTFAAIVFGALALLQGPSSVAADDAHDFRKPWDRTEARPIQGWVMGNNKYSIWITKGTANITFEPQIFAQEV